MITVWTDPLHEGPPGEVEAVNPIRDSSTRYQQLRGELYQKSTRAREIIDLLETHENNVCVFLNRDGMESMYFPPGFENKDGDGNVIFRVPEQCSGGLAVIDVGRAIWVYPKDAPKRALPLEISLIHELGHAEQRITKLDWYTTQFQLLNDHDERVRKQALKTIEDNDNLPRNEWPVCDQFGLPRRPEY